MDEAREASMVELVDESGLATGSATVAAAHTEPGLLHRAFSVLLFDDNGRTLLQQRAQIKSRFPLRWANACCGHPEPGQGVIEAATQRLAEELGVTGVPLTEVGVYTYRAGDPTTGRVEREYDHVVVGRLAAGSTTEPDPAEVANLEWVPTQTLTEQLADSSEHAPWLRGVLGVALSVIALPEVPQG